MDIIIFVFSVIVVIASLLYLERMRRRVAFGRYVGEAAKRSAFSPTEFHIYDKSTESRCDRLIVVQPFDWHVWAVAGQLYILNPEGGIVCGAGSVPAVKVLRDQFLEVCLALDYDSLLRGYTAGVAPSKIVPYTINSDTFTILSALNILVRGYVTFDDPATTKAHAAAMNTIPDRDEGYAAGESIDNNRDIDNDSDTNDSDRRTKRSLSGESVVRVSVGNKKTYQELLEQYRWHTRRPEPEPTIQLIKTTMPTRKDRAGEDSWLRESAEDDAADAAFVANERAVAALAAKEAAAAAKKAAATATAASASASSIENDDDRC